MARRKPSPPPPREPDSTAALSDALAAAIQARSELDVTLKSWIDATGRLSRIFEFVKQVGALTRSAPGSVAVLDRVQAMIAWDQCSVHTPPDPAAWTSVDEWEAQSRWWTNLRTAAPDHLGYTRVELESTKKLWKLPVEAREVAYAWIPPLERNSKLLFAWKAREADEDERETAAANLLLAALLLAGAGVPTGTPAQFHVQFHERHSRHKQLEQETNQLPADDSSEKLIAQLTKIRSGPLDARAFQDVVGDVLRFVFDLPQPSQRLEHDLHGGLKRIDIVYRNEATRGLFHNLPTKHLIPCPYILVECKNYSDDLSNPEIDQLLGRFGEGRGHFGFLICLKIKNRNTLLQRCREATRDRRGWIIALDTHDLIAFIHAKRLGGEGVWDLLDFHFRLLTF